MFANNSAVLALIASIAEFRDSQDADAPPVSNERANARLVELIRHVLADAPAAPDPHLLDPTVEELCAFMDRGLFAAIGLYRARTRVAHETAEAVLQAAIGRLELRSPVERQPALERQITAVTVEAAMARLPAVGYRVRNGSVSVRLATRNDLETELQALVQMGCEGDVFVDYLVYNPDGTTTVLATFTLPELCVPCTAALAGMVAS